MGSAPYLGGGFGHFYAYAPIKIEYAIDRFAMEVKRQLDVLDRRLAESEYLAGAEYTIADIAVFPWYGGLVKGWQYGRGGVPVGARLQERPALGRRHPRAAGGEARPHGQPYEWRSVKAAPRAPRRQRLRKQDPGQAHGGTDMNINGKRVLVTGGSSGIGLALAHAFLAKGAKVVITGRRPDALAKAVQELRENYSHAWSVAANVASSDGRAATIRHALEALGGLDILVNNAGGVRAGRLENTPEAELQAMIDVDLVAPILLTRAVLPALRASGDAMVVNVSSGIALIGAPFYATYAATKAGLAHFGEALRRELKGEDVHVLTVYPGGTDTPMMKSNRAGPELGFAREPATAVADAVVQGIEANAFEVVRGGEARAQMVALNRKNPAAVDERFFGLKPALENAVKDHSAL